MTRRDLTCVLTKGTEVVKSTGNTSTIIRPPVPVPYLPIRLKRFETIKDLYMTKRKEEIELVRGGNEVRGDQNT